MTNDTSLDEQVLTACDRLKEIGIRDASPSPTRGYVQIPLREAQLLAGDSPVASATPPKPSPDSPRHPEIEVRLLGTSSSAMAIMGEVVDAIKAYSRTHPEELSRADANQSIKEFRAEATSGDYDHLLQTAMSWVDVS